VKPPEETECRLVTAPCGAVPICEHLCASHQVLLADRPPLGPHGPSSNSRVCVGPGEPARPSVAAIRRRPRKDAPSSGWASWAASLILLRIRRRHEGILAVRHHLRGEALREGLRHGVQVAQHHVATPPAHQADGVGVHLAQEESLRSSCPHGPRAHILRSEANLIAEGGDCRSKRRSDLSAAHLLPRGT